MRNGWVAVLPLSFLISCASMAQQTSARPAAVTGRPYSAEQMVEHTQTLNDGTQISEIRQRTRMYRDSAGRVRTETFIYPKGADPESIWIHDPVAGFTYEVQPRAKTVYRVAIPVLPAQRPVATGVVYIYSARRPGPNAGNEVPAPPPATETGRRPEHTTASLGNKEIEGVTCEGKISKTIFPEGWMGNNRPIVTTSEWWTSLELGITVLSKRSDPRSGEDIERLTQISRAEPESTLFQPPPDFKMVDGPSGGFGH